MPSSAACAVFCLLAAATSGAGEGEGWLAAEVRHFRTYPHLDRAYRLINGGRLEEARAELERCLAIDPRDGQAQSALLGVLMRLRASEDVVRVADGILRGQPDSVDAHRQRAAALEALGRGEDSLRDLQWLSAPGRVGERERRDVLARVAETALRLGRPAEALAALDRLPPAARDHRYFMRRAQACERLDGSGDAAEAYRGAFAHAADAGERRRAAAALAEAAARSGDWGGAVRWNREVLASAASREERAHAHTAAAHAYARLGRTTEAYAHFRAAARLRPDGSALLGAAAMLERQGRLAQAVAELERALEARALAPGQRADALERLGFALQAQGAAGASWRAFARALELRPQEERLYRAAGQAALAAGDAAQAARYLRRGVRSRPDLVTWRALAQAEALSGNAGGAIAVYERLLADDTLAPETAAELLAALAQLYVAAGRDAEAAELFLEADARGPGAGDALAQASECLARSGEWSEAVRAGQRLLARAELPAGARADAFLRVAAAEGHLGRHEAAARSLRFAIALGHEGWRVRLDLAGHLYAAGRWTEALDEAQASLADRRSSQGHLYAARALEELGRPGLALHHLRAALALGGEIPRDEQVHVQRELCFLYAQEAADADALAACEAALAGDPDPGLRLRVAVLQRGLGRFDQAARTLSALDLAALSAAQRAAALDEQAALHEAQGRPREAIEALRAAMAAEPGADRSYRLGLRLREVGAPRDATAALAEAVRRDPANDRYREALGYAELALRRDAEATRVLEPVALRDPDYLELPRDLAYAHLRLAQNAQADRWFTVAIDNGPLYPTRSGEDEARLGDELLRMREQLARLRNRYDFSAYATVRSAASLPGGGAAGLPSESGAEVAWQPPVIGFRAERTVQAFARILGSAPVGEALADGSGAQAGVGLRWKPLAAHDFTLWGERLLRVGGGARSDWLLRAIYGWTRGAGLETRRGSWSYSYGQGDLARFVSARATAVYAEARQGRTFPLREDALLTPHVIADGRREWSGSGARGWVEGGAGLGLKLLFRQTAHEANRSSLELRLYYKRGRALTPSGSRPFQGWIVATAVQL